MSVTESQFYMWRTIFALSHADGVVSAEEKQFMLQALVDVPFSQEQDEILREDINIAQAVDEMFVKISNPQDQAMFFKFASRLAHIDGDYGKAEQDVMLRLKQTHLKNVDVDDLVGHVDLSFEEDEQSENTGVTAPKKKNFKELLYSYRDAFLKKIVN